MTSRRLHQCSRTLTSQSTVLCFVYSSVLRHHPPPPPPPLPPAFFSSTSFPLPDTFSSTPFFCLYAMEVVSCRESCVSARRLLLLHSSPHPVPPPLPPPLSILLMRLLVPGAKRVFGSSHGEGLCKPSSDGCCQDNSPLTREVRVTRGSCRP